MKLSNAAKAGAAIFVGTLQFGIFLLVSEILYSAYGTGGYSVSANFVSDLGANCPNGGACYVPPSSVLFDTSTAILGVAFLAGSYFIERAFRWNPATILLALAGIGSLGVGLFPETTGIFHSIFILVAFLFAGLSAVLLSRFQKKPMSYFAIILGLTTLAMLALVIAGVNLGLGNGGIERMVIYPVLLSFVGLGGHLMATEDPPQPSQRALQLGPASLSSDQFNRSIL
jgi:hypothetical membrane protein